MDIKKVRFIAVVILALSLSFTCHYAQAKDKPVEIDLSKPDRSEVLEEIAKHTGLTKDVVELVYAEQADVFKGLDNLVFADKVFNLVLEAKDTEALTEVVMKFLEYRKDALVEQAFPAAVGTFLTFASAYKASLEMVRDYHWIPKYEDKIYRAYKESRDKDREENRRIAEMQGVKVDESKLEDTSQESRDTAFNMGVMTKASGYYAVKEKMLNEMVKEKLDLKSTDAAGDKALEILRKQVDDFWINRLEMKYQQERLKARGEGLEKEMWDKNAQQLEAIRAAAAKMSGPQRFFFSEKDIPQGWKKIKEGPHRTYKFTPRGDNNPSNPGWVQGFGLYKAEYTQKGDDFFTSDGRAANVNDIDVTIFISPRMVKYVTDKNIPFEDDSLDSIKFMLTGWDSNPGWESNPEWEPNPGQKFYGKFMEEGVLLGYVEGGWGTGSNVNWYGVMFVKGSWRVQVSVNGNSLASIQEDEARIIKAYGKSDIIYDKTMVSEELARTIARTVARKIPAAEPGQKEAKKK